MLPTVIIGPTFLNAQPQYSHLDNNDVKTHLSCSLCFQRPSTVIGTGSYSENM